MSWTPLKKPTSPSFLETLMSDLSLFEKLPLEVLNEGVFSSMGDLYGGKAVKEVWELMKDATLFKMAATVCACHFCFFFWFNVCNFCPMLTDLSHFLCRWVFMALTWWSTMIGGNTNLVASLLCVRALEHCTTMYRRSLGWLSLKKC